MSKADWIWMPHPGHLIVAKDCKFHLNTKVSNYIVSTVGEYIPDAPIREILAESRGVKLRGKGDDRFHDYMKKIGYEDVGCNRKYETMVFRAFEIQEELCCPYVAADWTELEVEGYNHARAAFEGHIAMCEKYDEL